MPSSRQATVLVLPAGKKPADQTTALRVARHQPTRPDLTHVTIAARLRPPSYLAPAAPTRTSEIRILREDVRWGAVFAGLLAAIVLGAGISLLGLVLGMTVLEPYGATVVSNVGHYLPLAVVWTVGASMFSLFLGGFVAAKSSAVHDPDAALLSGMMVFLSGLVLALSLAVIVIGLALKTLGIEPVNLYIFGYSAINDPTVPSAIAVLRPLLWGTVAALIVGFLASSLGGLAASWNTVTDDCP